MSPSPTLSLRGCKTEGLGSTDPGRPDPGQELGLPPPSTSLIPQCTPAASQPRRVSYPPRPRDEDRRSVRGSAARAELRSVRRCRSPQAGCCLFRGSCSIRQPKPAAGGNRRKVAPVRGGLSMIRPLPRTWPGCGEGCGAALSPRRPPARALSAALGPDPWRLRRAPRSRGGAPPAPPLAPDGGCGRPQVRRRRCYAEREAVGLPGPRSSEAGAQPISYLSGWADTSRAPSQENQHEGKGQGKAAGGFRTR